VNACQLIGRLTRDPDHHTAPSGKTVCRMRLAVPRGPDDPPVYIDTVAFAGLGDTCAAQLAKGHQIAVSGRLDYVEWTADDGSKRSKHEVIASRVDFLARPAGDRSRPTPPAGAHGTPDDEADDNAAPPAAPDRPGVAEIPF
jgi:single-strand DNA-binding protein